MAEFPLRFTVLGPVRAWCGAAEIDLGGPKQRAVLGLLLVHAGQPVQREAIIDLLWPDGPPSSAVNIVQTYIKRIRRALEPERASHSRLGPLRWVRGGYLLSADPESVDLGRFRSLVRQGRSTRTAAPLWEAIELWQGPPLAGTSAGQHPLTAELEHERVKAIVDLADAELAAGNAGSVVPVLAQAAATAPFHEPLHARLIDACHRAGRTAEALRGYERIRLRLRDELGVDPSSELRQLYETLLHDATSPEPSHDLLPTPLPGQPRLVILVYLGSLTW